jgi:hypothetical protein
VLSRDYVSDVFCPYFIPSPISVITPSFSACPIS